MSEVVTPKRAEGFNISWNLNLFSGPKWTIVCGKCEATFKARIPTIDYPTVVCPHCGAVNELDLVFTSMGDDS